MMFWRICPFTTVFGLTLLFLMLFILSLGMSGCESMSRGVARLHGFQGDPFPGSCAPESVQTGQCVAVKQGAK